MERLTKAAPRSSRNATGDGSEAASLESLVATTSRERSDIFRPEFLREYSQRTYSGDVLRVTPQWVKYGYWLVIGLAIGVAIYAVFGQVNEYAAGPAIIRLGERADLTSITAGTVVNVLVRAGEAVKAGQILVQFYSAQESAELAQSDREFELELVNLLRDPSNQDARQSMARLRSERDRRLARLEERSMRTPIEGTVSDIRITPGQHLETGDPVMSVLGRSSRRLLIAMLPGYYRPLLRSGLPIRLELTGYPYVHQDLSVSKIGDEIVGPAAVRRYLGRDFADAVPLTGAAVLVYSELPGGGFVWEDRERVYFDGMQGRVRVKVRTQSALLALIPGLRKMIGSHAD